MSKYNRYARELDKAFRSTVMENAEIRKRVRELEDTVNSNSGWRKFNTTDGEEKFNIKVARDNLNLKEAREEADNWDGWDKFFKRAEELTNGLKAEYEK